MQVKQLCVSYIEESLSVRLGEDLLNFLVEISDTHEILFLQLESN